MQVSVKGLLMQSNTQLRKVLRVLGVYGTQQQFCTLEVPTLNRHLKKPKPRCCMLWLAILINTFKGFM